jgi:methionyl-tRNA formyltransferase
LPDIGLSVLFDHILKPDFIEIFPQGVINLHPSYLPYNRGQYPNVWSIVDGTPAGVTLHYINEDIDTGDIIAQREVEVEPVDTGESLYRKLEHACVELFKITWPNIKSGKAPRNPQSTNAGTYYVTRDVDKIDEIDLDGTYTARELIDILRARTFPPYGGAYFRQGNHKVSIRVQLEYLDEE